MLRRFNLDQYLLPVLAKTKKFRRTSPNHDLFESASKRVVGGEESRDRTDDARQSNRRGLIVLASTVSESVAHFWDTSRYRIFGDGGANLMFEFDKHRFATKRGEIEVKTCFLQSLTKYHTGFLMSLLVIWIRYQETFWNIIDQK